MLWFLVPPAVAVFSLIALVWVAGDVLRRHFSLAPIRKGLCFGCGYALSGLRPTGDGTVVCPECGGVVRNGVTTQREPAGRMWGFVWAIGALAATPVIDVALQMPMARRIGGGEEAFFPAAAACCAGLTAVFLLAALSKFVRRRERRWLTLSAAVLQLAGAVAWTWWACEKLATMR